MKMDLQIFLSLLPLRASVERPKTSMDIIYSLLCASVVTT